MPIATGQLVMHGGTPVCVIMDRDLALAHVAQLGLLQGVERIRVYAGTSTPTLVPVTRRSGVVLAAEVRNDATTVRQLFDYDRLAQRLRSGRRQLELADNTIAYLFVVEGPDAVEVDTAFVAEVASIQASGF